MPSVFRHIRILAVTTLISIASTASIIPTVYAAPTERFAVVLGNNLGNDPQRALKYAEADAKKFHRVLTEIGQFKTTNTRLLLGKDAATIWQNLKEMAAQAKAYKQKTGGQTLFLLYYSGHADGDLLELGRTSLRFDALSSFVKSSFADVRLAFLDACHSGQLVAMKGARRGPAFQLQFDGEIGSSGYAIVTSSSADELSQETAEIRGSYFTHYLVSGLRGAGDETNDKAVSLGEIYRYVYAKTVARTSRTIGGAQHPMYDYKIAGKGEIFLTRTDPQTTAYISLDTSRKSRFVLMDADREAIIGEQVILPSQQSYFAVTPGPYVAYLIDEHGGKNRVLSKAIHIAAGQRLSINTATFKTQQLDVSVNKGGFFAPPPHVLSVGLNWLFRNNPLNGGVASTGTSLQLQYRHPAGLELTATMNYATAILSKDIPGHTEVGALFGAGYAYAIGKHQLHFGLHAGYEHLIQSTATGPTQHTPGFSYLGGLGYTYPLTFISDRLHILVHAGAGGRVFQVLNTGWVHRLNTTATVGLSWDAMMF